MRINVSLVLPRDEISVPVIRRMCGGGLEDLGVGSACVDDIQLAVTEACTNVLKHARDTSDEYEVSITITERKCVIRVIDAGSGFEDDGLGRKIVQGASESGRGIHLMRSLVDSVRFNSRPESGTIVRLEKELEVSESSPLRLLGRKAAPAT